MISVGLNFGTHDASAAIVEGGILIAAYEEERFTGIKKERRFPANALDMCLRIANVSKGDVDRVGIYLKPFLHLNLGYYSCLSAGFRSPGLLLDSIKLVKKTLDLKNEVISYFGRKSIKVIFLQHHLCHAAAVFLQSPFEEAGVLVVDGRGEYESVSIFLGKGTSLRKRYSIAFPQSLGYFYSAITKYLGFEPQHDEYKIMGLAAYGNGDKYSGMLRRTVFREGRLDIDFRYYDFNVKRGTNRAWVTDDFERLIGYRGGHSMIGHGEAADIARGAQVVLEEAYLQLVKFAMEITRQRCICLTGGVVLNCAANKRVATEVPDLELFAHPASHDAGTAIGAALLVNNARRKCPLTSPFVGKLLADRKDGDGEAFKNRRQRLNAACYDAALELSHGMVIGWYEKDMEIGPRALGHRNILASPSSKELADRINMEIKGREPFRPLAPAIRAESFGTYFYSKESAAHLYDYMLATADVRPERIAEIAGVVHVDNTARPQIVKRETNEWLWKIINEYAKITGVPVVLSTSLNVAGEPMPASEEQALIVSEKAGLDAIYVDGVKYRTNGCSSRRGAAGGGCTQVL